MSVTTESTAAMTAATLPGTEPSAGDDDATTPDEARRHPSGVPSATASAQRRQISPGVIAGVAGAVAAALLAVVGGLISAGFSDLREDIRALGDRIESQGDRVDSLGGRIDAQGGRIDSLGDRIESQDSRIDSLGDRIDAQGGHIDSLAAELRAAMREGFAQVNRTLAEHGRLLRDHSERLARLEALIAPPGAAPTGSDAPPADPG